jgi:hypothetical protein
VTLLVTTPLFGALPFVGEDASRALRQDENDTQERERGTLGGALGWTDVVTQWVADSLVTPSSPESTSSLRKPGCGSARASAGLGGARRQIGGVDANRSMASRAGDLAPESTRTPPTACSAPPAA